jgi:hypothetical protein
MYQLWADLAKLPADSCPEWTPTRTKQEKFKLNDVAFT